MPYAMYSPITVIDTTARKATGTPAELPFSAGSVTIKATTAIRITALNGTRSLLTLLHRRQPGIAPSRLNAKHMREALVRHAMPQNSWPTVEMIRISLTQLAFIAVVNTAITDPAPYPFVALLIVPTCVAANVIASRTM